MAEGGAFGRRQSEPRLWGRLGRLKLRGPEVCIESGVLVIPLGVASSCVAFVHACSLWEEPVPGTEKLEYFRLLP